MKVKLVANQITLASLIIAVFVVGGFLGNYYLAQHAISTSDHRWCTTLALLTSEPVPKPADPAANPSRQNAYLFYIHLQTLEREFRCA